MRGSPTVLAVFAFCVFMVAFEAWKIRSADGWRRGWLPLWVILALIMLLDVARPYLGAATP